MPEASTPAAGYRHPGNDRGQRAAGRGSSGFTLVELLTAIAIVAILSVAALPALQSLTGAGTTNRAINDLSQTIEMARSYAMANHTYVRLVFSPLAAGVGGQSSPAILVLAMYPASGGIDSTNDSPQNMGDASLWPLMSQPLRLSNLVSNDALNTASPNTDSDAYPSQSDMVQGGGFTRAVQAISPAPTFTSCLQIDSSGDVQVKNGIPARYIKMAFDHPAPQNGKDPFILRVYGINGRIYTLRKENGVQ